MKKSISCCSLTSQSTNMFVWSCNGLILDCKRCLICTYFYPDSDEMTFSLENAMLLRTCILVGSCNDGFDSLNTQFFMSQDVNWWTGVVWISCGLLWCFYQLFGLSFWLLFWLTSTLSLSFMCIIMKVLHLCFVLRLVSTSPSQTEVWPW